MRLIECDDFFFDQRPKLGRKIVDQISYVLKRQTRLPDSQTSWMIVLSKSSSRGSTTTAPCSSNSCTRDESLRATAACSGGHAEPGTRFTLAPADTMNRATVSRCQCNAVSNGVLDLQSTASVEAPARSNKYAAASLPLSAAKCNAVSWLHVRNSISCSLLPTCFSSIVTSIRYGNP